MTPVESQRTVDLLIEARWVVPVEPHGVVLENHAVAIAGDRIAAVLPIAEARATLRTARAHRARRARADPGPRQRAHAQPDDADARPRRRPAADALAAGAHLAGRSEGDQPRVRARRRRARRSPRCCAAAPPAATRTISSRTCRPRRIAGSAFARWSPADHRISERLGEEPRRILRQGPRRARRVPRRTADRHEPRRRTRRTRSPTKASSASACCPTSSTSRCICICTRPRRKSRTPSASTACVRSRACRRSGSSTIT